MASRRLWDRPVDLGASYFTVSDPEFGAVVGRLGRPRPGGAVDRHLLGAGGRRAHGQERPGAVGCAATACARSSRTWRADLAVERAELADLATWPPATVVLAMPDPQARRLCGDHPVADVLDRDVGAGARAGGALGPSAPGTTSARRAASTAPSSTATTRSGGWPTTAAAAATTRPSWSCTRPPTSPRRHLEDPSAAGPDDGRGRCAGVMGLDEPADVHVHRWTFARPVGERERAYALVEGPDRLGRGLRGRVGADAQGRDGLALGDAAGRASWWNGSAERVRDAQRRGEHREVALGVEPVLPLLVEDHAQALGDGEAVGVGHERRGRGDRSARARRRRGRRAPPRRRHGAGPARSSTSSSEGRTSRSHGTPSTAGRLVPGQVERVPGGGIGPDHAADPARVREAEVAQGLDERPLVVDLLVQRARPAATGPARRCRPTAGRAPRTPRGTRPRSVGRISARSGVRRSSSASTRRTTSTPLTTSRPSSP